MKLTIFTRVVPKNLCMVDLKVGSFIKLNDEVAEVVNIGLQHNKTTFRTLRDDIVGAETDLKVEPILIERKLLTTCCGFDGNGLLKLNIDGKIFYLQEHSGYIILQDADYTPLIYFWEVTQLDQLQLLYYRLSGTKLTLSLSAINDFFNHQAAMI